MKLNIMARVTYGESITELAGSIGGVTYQKNASGNIARLRPKPTVNPTPQQAAYQTRFAMLVAYWPILAQEDKNAWNDLAAANKHTTPWGVEKTLSGYQFFMSCNLIHLMHYTTVLEAPLVWLIPPPVDQFSLQATHDHLKVIFSPPYDSGYSFLTYASLPLRQSSLKLRRSLFFLYEYWDCPELTEWNITTYIENLYNVNWCDFYDNSICHIIIRILNVNLGRGYASAFTSAIVKIG